MFFICPLNWFGCLVFLFPLDDLELWSLSVWFFYFSGISGIIVPIASDFIRVYPIPSEPISNRNIPGKFRYVYCRPEPIRTRLNPNLYRPESNSVPKWVQTGLTRLTRNPIGIHPNPTRSPEVAGLLIMLFQIWFMNQKSIINTSAHTIYLFYSCKNPRLLLVITLLKNKWTRAWISGSWSSLLFLFLDLGPWLFFVVSWRARYLIINLTWSDGKNM